MMKEIKQNKKQDRPTRSGLLLFLHLTASSVELIKGVLFMEEISLLDTKILMGEFLV